VNIEGNLISSLNYFPFPFHFGEQTHLNNELEGYKLQHYSQVFFGGKLKIVTSLLNEMIIYKYVMTIISFLL